MRAIPVLLMVAAALAGCIGGDVLPEETPDAGVPIRPGPQLGTALIPSFSVPKILDSLRAGGEPVIAITPKGTILVGAHPGYTHWHPDPGAVPPTTPELVLPSQTQSYMWRSTDGGDTFRHVSLLPVDAPNSGPRGLGQGVSDPDFAIDSDGRIYFTDLEALASASVSWSDDDGATWLMGNNAASGGVIDRQWLATYGTTVYFRGNYFAPPQDVRKSEDGGLTWQNLGDAGCGGDIVANPLDGHLFVGCGGGFSVSTDGGETWHQRGPRGFGSAGPIEAEPAIDAAGTVYLAGDKGRDDIVLAWTHDEGVTWENLSLKSYFPELANGTLIWPWTSAGSEGRVSVTFYASPSPEAFQDASAEWFVYNAILIGVGNTTTYVYPTQVTPEPFHRGGMCQGGTACQATTAVDENSDRRLGDFFETTIDAEGFVHIVYSDTQARASDTISHVGYARLLDGPRLVEGVLPPGFPTQG